MNSTGTVPAPLLHHVDDQIENLIASSNVDWLLSGTMDHEEAKLPSQPESDWETTPAEEGNAIIPPLQPEGKVVKDNKAVPW